mgnify:CR=1 FL=1
MLMTIIAVIIVWALPDHTSRIGSAVLLLIEITPKLFCEVELVLILTYYTTPVKAVFQNIF